MADTVITYTDRAYYAAVSRRPSWRKPFPRAEKSRRYYTSGECSHSVRRRLARRGVVGELAAELAELAERRIGRWIYQGDLRVKIDVARVKVQA